MMLNYFEKVKGYLLDLGHDIVSEDAGEGMLLVTDQSKGLMNTMLDCEGEILVIEQHIIDLDPSKTEAYKRLLQINREVVHGAFVLNEDASKLLFRDTLQLANLDANELEGSLNALTIALVENTDELLGWAIHETIA
ncbi:YbjN domain-containing protein [Aureispira anguillae]|uniref:YbjN domain-containing protein n=1 Tax=Aureispira anguillae TaxID=2864201 RepID=A0A916DV79_9BACT|nr:YbjN domain-containing protein [Aureispira anguillae]BDS13255.1 YbjN domain-containing protein [Aureispira anguillae]